jgi:hypothetical protein
MSPLLTLGYWFSLNPTPLAGWAEKTLLIGFAVLFLAGIAVWFFAGRSAYSKFTKRALGRVAAHLAWTGFIGLILWVFAYEQVPLLSIRVAFIAWFIWLAVGAWFIGQYAWKEIPAMEARNRERLEREKWLPKRK